MKRYPLNHPFVVTLPSPNNLVTISIREGLVSIDSKSLLLYGLGERFASVNHQGKQWINKVEEQFCHQQQKTYFPIPFFFSPEGWGIYIATTRVIQFSFQNGIDIDLTGTAKNDELIVFEGAPEAIVSEFMALTGKPKLPPKWAFGPWISGHRWKSEALVLDQIKALEKYHIPATALVIEQWSDEATFYVFNGATYTPKSEGFSYSDFSFDPNGLWSDPKHFIDTLHQHGLKLLLWQVSVIKELEAHEPGNQQHALDQQEAIQHHYVATMPDGSPYRIPKGHWFPHSMIPDFTSPKAREWWFSKRQYLLDIGVDGFKTDGGEFVYSDASKFYDGSTGEDMTNRYAATYISSYDQFIGANRVLFSRAGYVGQQQHPILWAGDQASEWGELKSALNAGLSSGLSGQIFWSFDMAGFSGPLPGVELYVRSMQLATFVPIMQLHSEPMGGQFAGMRATLNIVNDRTPWNIASYHNDETPIRAAQFFFNLRMNLLPTLYSEAVQAVRAKVPLMKHPVLIGNYPLNDLHRLDEQFHIGPFLVAPIIHQGQKEKEIYLPVGTWYHLFTHDLFKGEQWISLPVTLDDIPIFVASGSAILVNTDKHNTLGSFVGNDVASYNHLTAYLFGPSGFYHFEDDLGNTIDIEWDKSKKTYQGTLHLPITMISII